MIKTQFYSNSITINRDDYKGVDQNYTDYLLFSLKSWVQMWVNTKLLNVYIDIIDKYDDITSKEKVYKYIVIKNYDDENLKLSNDYLNYLTTNINQLSTEQLRWIPIFSNKYDLYTNDGAKIPNLWIKQMLNFINIDSGYKPYISEYGLFADISMVPDYTSLAGNLMFVIKQKLINMYLNGYILKPTNNIINNWKLIPINNNNDNNKMNDNNNKMNNNDNNNNNEDDLNCFGGRGDYGKDIFSSFIN